MPRAVLGLDIGGANLKAAHSDGSARLTPFALWKQPERLADALRELVASLPPPALVAATMTGELCDCYASKCQGVRAILQAIDAVRGRLPALVWRTDGRFAGLEDARAEPLSVAAANWVALATFAGRYAEADVAVLLDVGSTTTDVVPLVKGMPVPVGRTDRERLASGELIYTGVRRTPVCALLGGRGAAEWFATTLDVYLLLGEIHERPEDCDTADGRPATLGAAHARLARMVGGDAEGLRVEEAVELARRIAERQVRLIRAGVRRVLSRLPTPLRAVILSGSGEFLARRVVAGVPTLQDANVVSLADRLGAERSASACAYALAMLAAERDDP